MFNDLKVGGFKILVGKSPFLIGYAFLHACFSIVILVFRGVGHLEFPAIGFAYCVLWGGPKISKDLKQSKALITG